MKRIFIVGTARSGTTLSQSLIGNHPDIFTLPETHFLPYAIPKQKWLRPFRGIKPNQVARVQKLLTGMELRPSFQPEPSNWARPLKWTECFVQYLDQLAKTEGKKTWLEKTPMHLYYIDLIKKVAPDSLFIHTIREPKANIAALYEVSKEHPQAFKQTSLSKAIKRYKTELLISQKYQGHRHHFHLYYEDLVENTSTNLKAIQGFLGLKEFDLRHNFENQADGLILDDEKWKAHNRKEIALKSKLAKRLDPMEMATLEKALKNFHPPLLSFYEA